jgi:hypothetical protein
MEAAIETASRAASEPQEPRDRPVFPFVSDGEREFWRRAVEAERRRQRCGRPAPFPFQPA